MAHDRCAAMVSKVLKSLGHETPTAEELEAKMVGAIREIKNEEGLDMSYDYQLVKVHR